MNNQTSARLAFVRQHADKATDPSCVSIPTETLRGLLETLEHWLKGQRSALNAAQSLLDNREKPWTPEELDQWTQALAFERETLDVYERDTRAARDKWARKVGGLRTIVPAPNGVM